MSLHNIAEHKICQCLIREHSAYKTSSLHPYKKNALYSKTSTSSKKQQNIDLMVTFGKPYRDFPYLTGFIPKCRRGEVGRKFRVKTEFERMHAEEISEVQYHSELNAYLGSQGGN